MDLDACKKSRKNAKQAITRIYNWVATNKDIETNGKEFQIREDILKKSFDKYCEAQDCIEDLDPNDSESRDDFETRYCSLLSAIQGGIEKLSPVSKVQTKQPSSFQVLNTPSVKLPDLRITPFDGQISEWKSFFELFSALIINNTGLTDIQRFIYLKSALKGEALKLVDSLEVTSDNFQVALTILQKRYENLTCVVNSHFNNILDISPIIKCTSITLRDFIANLKKNIESLKKLKIGEKEIFDYLLVYIFEKKLDFGTKRAFELDRDLDELPSLEDFFEFLEKRCIVYENLTSSESRPSRKSEKISLYTGHQQKQVQPTCIICGNSNHKIYSCPKFSALPHIEKETLIKSKNLCFNCLAKHKVQDCGSNQKCRVCNKKHHTLLHQERTFSTNVQGTQNFQSTNAQNANSQSQNTSPSVQSRQSSNLRLQSNLNPSSQVFVSRNQTESHQSQRTQTSTQPTSSGGTQNGSNSAISLSAFSNKESHVLLATAQVTLYSKQGNPINAKVLLDNGSQSSFITQKLVNKLQCSCYRKVLNISGISQNSIISNKMADVCIHSQKDTSRRFLVSCVILDNITYKLPQVPIQASKLQIPEHIATDLADHSFFIPSDIDMLLGADLFYSLITTGVFSLGHGFPTLLNTHLGWIIAGNVPSRCMSPLGKSQSVHSQNQHVQNNVSFFLQTQELDNLLTKFWEVEEIQTKTVLAPDEDLAETIFSSTTKILKDGSFQVDMPLKTSNEHHKLGDSFQIAQKRFFTLENRFQKDPNLFLEYKNFIEEYIALGHAKYVPLSLTNENNEHKYFIPHLCIIRESSTTTKLRVVFDASAKTSTGVSLNDVTLKGYQVQPELYDILCRFRLFQYVLTSDIRKMYRQVKINSSHHFLQNILWRDKPTDPLKCIELQTVTYGTNFAPFVATRVLKEVALLNEKEFPLASDALLLQCYVDDILAGCDSYDKLQTLHSELNTVLNNAGFKLHKWCSNSQKFLKTIAHDEIFEYDLNFDETPNKVLGLKWQPKDDVFIISTPQISLDKVPTKRTILSVLAQCFDPLGLVNPVIVKGKILMQQLWTQKLDWDTEIVDEKVLRDWESFVDAVSFLNNLKIPRRLFFENSSTKVEIHGFADASISAYGACIYVRSINTDNAVCCALISAKSRVAPIKTITLPRLELCGMLILAKLAERIVNIFDHFVDIVSVNLWSDSKIALAWCDDHPSRWSTFVSHRVSQIQNLTTQYKWRHVKSSNNPADILSRGLFSQEIIDAGSWFNGPPFLRDPNLKLSQFDTPVKISNIPEERKISGASLPVPDTNNSSCVFWNKIFSGFSKFSRLQRTVAYVTRFIHNSKNRNSKLSGPLSIDELDSAHKIIIKNLQLLNFSKQISELKTNFLSDKQFRSLKPFLDSEQFLRVGGRLDNADISYEQKHPLLLPSHNHVVSIMLDHEHKRLGHAGAQTVLSNFRLRFWPLNGLREIKRVIRKCVTCFRFRALPAQQIMAALPKERVQISRPFQKVGIDFGGPFFIKTSRLRKAPSVKGYICIFVCMTTKAVHIELVSSLSTEAFLMTLKRFASRRGNPTVIFSDNATNFQGSNNHLKALHDFWKDSHNYQLIKDYLSQNQVEWKFIPPRSPHWGGIWEAAIKSAKYHVNRLVGNSPFTFEEFYTIITQIEAILNSRPLCPLTSDPSDLECLTPGHFLIGTNLTAYPEKDLTDIPENRLKFWQKCTQIQQTFWKRWSTDYLNRLQNRPKWLKPFKNIKINDIVLLREDNVPPLHWPRARILEIYPGRDGNVRVVKLKTSSGTFTRSIAKVSPLPCYEISVQTNVIDD